MKEVISRIIRMFGVSPVLYAVSVQRARGVVFSGLALTLASVSGTAQAQNGSLNITQVTGRAEVQSGSGNWQSLTTEKTVSKGLRTGSGRVTLTSRSLRVTVGSASQMRAYQNEPDFQEGQFYVEGSGGFFSQGWHANAEAGSRVRIDLAPLTKAPRIAAVQGRVRLALGSRRFTLQKGQQLLLKTGEVSPFTENDPWYQARFSGEGRAKLEALRGQVQRRRVGSSQTAKRGEVLVAGDHLITGAASWAEVGFSGGGYLRLSEQSELSVVAVDKTSAGREITLHLLRGSVWNIVQKGQGGYRISTPVVSTAVRGTQFRVDADGLVKVFEGSVELPEETGMLVGSGTQKQAGQATRPLEPDALDQLNQQLDQSRSRPLTLAIQWPEPQTSKEQGAQQEQEAAVTQRRLNPEVISLPDASLTLRIGQRTVALQEDGHSGIYRLPPETLQPEEGRYTVTVRAERLGQVLEERQRILLDATAPRVEVSAAQHSGRVFELRGEVSDTPAGRVQVQLRLSDGQTLTHFLPTGPFHLVLPAAQPVSLEQLRVSDAAGNESYAALP